MRKSFEVVKSNCALILKLGAGFFADAYDLFVIDIVLSVFNEIDTEDPTGLGYTSSMKSLIASATAFGAIVGMILFGFVGDLVGRRLAVLITGSLVACGSILSACCMRSDSFPLITQLVICRAILGVGIGGEYPLSATIASEGSSWEIRDRVVAGVFSMQGFGTLTSAALACILFKCGASLEFTWRFLLAFGCVPALVALKFRIAMHEYRPSSVRSQADSVDSHIGDLAIAKSPVAVPSPVSVTLVGEKCVLCPPVAPCVSTNPCVPHGRSHWSVIWEYRRCLFGTSLCWFLLDVTFYGTGEFKHSVGESINGNSSAESAALFALYISIIALPGYLCTVFFITKIGRWRLQCGGFFVMVLTYIGMAVSIHYEAPPGVQLFVFGASFFATNFGPNATTFIIPSEIFPSFVRAICHGMSAAFGKAGAVVGGAGFPVAESAIGLANVMFICSGIAFCGFLTTIIVLPKRLVQPTRSTY